MKWRVWLVGASYYSQYIRKMLNIGKSREAGEGVCGFISLGRSGAGLLIPLYSSLSSFLCTLFGV